MKKFWSLATVMCVMSALLIFSACGDPYANMSVDTSVTTMEFVLDDSNAADSQSFIAEVKGGGKNISRRIAVVCEPAGVVTASVSFENNINTVTVTPLSGGTANLILKTIEGGYSRNAVSVNVAKPIKGLAFAGTPQSVAVGGSLVLSAGLFSFMPGNTTELGINYSIKSSVPGVTLNGNVLAAAAGSAVAGGFVTIVAQSRAISPNMMPEQTAALTTEFDVLIYEEITVSAISIKIYNESAMDENLVDFVLAKNTDYANEAEFEVFVNTGQSYVVNAVAADGSVAHVQHIAGTSFILKSIDKGRTKLLVTVSIVDVNGIVYVEISKDYNITVIDVVERIDITEADGTTSSSKITTKVYTSYEQGTIGTMLTVVPAPSNASFRTFTVGLYALGGNEVFDSASAGVQVFVEAPGFPNGEPVELNKRVLSGGSKIFVRIDKDKYNFANTSFELVFTSNLGMPKHHVYAYAEFFVVAGVTDLRTPALEVGVGGQIDFVLQYITDIDGAWDNIKISTDGIQEFTLTPPAADIVVFSTPSPGNYRLIGMKEGNTTLRIAAGNGRVKTIPIWVFSQATAIGLDVTLSASTGVVKKEPILPTSPEAQDAYSNTSVIGSSAAYIARGSTFELNFLVGPTGATILDLAYLSSAPNIAMVAPTGQVHALATGYVTITATFTIVKYNGNSWDRIVGVQRTIDLDIFNPIAGINISSQNRTVLYDINSLFVLDNSQASTSIQATVSPSNSSFRASDIVWSYSDMELIDPQNLGDGRISVTAVFPSGYDGPKSKTIQITGTINEHGRNITVTTFVIVERPTKINGIIVDGYDDDRGVYLETREVGGANQRSSFTIKPIIKPANAYISQTRPGNELVYVVYHAVLNDDKGIAEATQMYKEDDEDAVIKYVWDSQLGLALLAGNIIEPIAGKSGWFVVKAIPRDQLTEARLAAPVFEPDFYYPIWGGVADGKEVPYRIFTLNDLINVGASLDNLSANYQLMNDISLASVGYWAPLGLMDEDSLIGFGGSLKSFSSGTQKTELRITGIMLDTGKAVIEGSFAYLGLFAKLESSAVIGNIILECTYFNLDLGDLSEEVTTVYAGILTGVSFAECLNVSVYSALDAGKRHIITDNSGINTASVFIGGIVGLLKGVIYSGSSVFKVDVSTPAASVYLGGMVGENRGRISALSGGAYNYSDVDFRLVYVDEHEAEHKGADKEESFVGGIAGKNAANDTSDENRLQYAVTSGFIYAPYNDNIGGIAGGHTFGTISLASSSVRITANSNIGGLVGINNGGSINRSVYEAYDNLAYRDLAATAIVAYGTNVGGLVGLSYGGEISYSFVLSYVSRTLKQHQSGGTTLTDSNEYYGDILSFDKDSITARVGGLIGYVNDSKGVLDMVACFSVLAIQSKDSAAELGGAIGRIEITQVKNSIKHSFSRGSIISLNQSAVFAGGFIGYVDATTTYSFIDYVYTITDNGTPDAWREFIGGSSHPAYAFASGVGGSYYAGTTPSSFGASSSPAADLKYMGEPGGVFHPETNWWFATLTEINNGNIHPAIFWAAWAGLTEGINDDYPVLLNHDKSGTLGSVIPESISLNLASEAGAFAAEKDTNQFILFSNLIADKNFKFSKLFEATVFPLAAADDLRVTVTVDNPAVATVLPGMDLLNHTLSIKANGTVKITVTANRNLAASVTFELCITNGLETFKMFNSLDRQVVEEIDRTTLGARDDDTLYEVGGGSKEQYPAFSGTNNMLGHPTIISVNKGGAVIVSPVPYVDGSPVSLNNAGVTYTTATSGPEAYYYFGNNDWDCTRQQQHMPFASDFTHLLTGVSTTLPITTKGILVKAIPYVMVLFNGVETRFPLEDLAWFFYIEVYNGLQSVTLDRSAVTLEPQDDLLLTVTINTDDKERFLTTRIYDEKYFWLEETIDGINKTDENRIGYNDLLGNNNKDDLKGKPYFESDGGLRYYIVPESLKLVDDGVEFRLLISIIKKDATEWAAERCEFKLLFGASDGTNTKTVELELTYRPQSVMRIDTDFYSSAKAYKEYASGGTEINSGGQGLLVVSVGPNYADFDYLLISSSESGGGESISFLHQAISGSGSSTQFRDVQPFASANEFGQVRINKINKFDSTSSPIVFDYDGSAKFYIATLLSRGVPMGTVFTITILAMKNGESEPLFAQGLSLTAGFSPYVDVALKVPNDNNLVARGTEVEFDLTVYALGSKLEVTAKNYEPSGNAEERKLSEIIFPIFDNEFNTKEPEIKPATVKIYFGLLSKGKVVLLFKLSSAVDLNAEPYETEVTVHIVDFVINRIFTVDKYGAEVDSNGLLVSLKTPATELKLAWEISCAVITGKTSFGDYYPSASSELTTAFDEEVGVIGNTINGVGGILAQINRADAGGNESPTGGGTSGGIWRANDKALNAGVEAEAASQFTVGYNGSYYTVLGKIISTDVRLLAKFHYRHVEDASGKYKFEFELDNDNFAENTKALNVMEARTEFGLNIAQVTTEEDPLPVESPSDLINMQAGQHYILHNNIVLNSFTPLTTEIASLDGNGYTITINSFNIPRRDSNNNLLDTINVGLFATINSATTLRNIIMDASGLDAPIDAAGVQNVNFGLITGINYGGNIYNCEVITGKNQSSSYNDFVSGTFTSLDYGRIVLNELRDNYNDNKDKVSTLQSLRLETSRAVGGNNVSVSMGGLVGRNEGFITNSRVGRIDNKIGNARNQISATVQGINLFGTGRLGGLVGLNLGTISSSYFANGLVVSSGNTGQGTQTAGLVGENGAGARILGSYAEGNINSIIVGDEENIDFGRAVSGGARSYGSVGGLVHTNRGLIENSYSNMNLISSSGSGGFVFTNLEGASITNCYTLSKIASYSLNNGVFTGRNNELDLLNLGQITSSYYLIRENSNVIVSDLEAAVGKSLSGFIEDNASAFVGFVFKNDNAAVNGAVWQNVSAPDFDEKDVRIGPKLIQANNIAWSYRDKDYSYDPACEYGKASNPVLIRNAVTFNNVFKIPAPGSPESSPYVSLSGGEHYMREWAHVRFICNVDFTAIQSQSAHSIVVKGHIDGNGMTLSGISQILITQSQEYGLFKRIDNGVVTNLGLSIREISATQTQMVGGLAGRIINSSVTEIRITTPNVGGKVSGANMVGGLAGLVEGKSQISNVTSSVWVNATRQPATLNEHYYYNPSLLAVPDQLYPYSYAGGIIGVLDLYDVKGEEPKYDWKDPSVNGLLVFGSVQIEGENVGGLVGTIGKSSCIAESAFYVSETSNSQALAGTNFVGGLVGISLGEIHTSFIGFEPSAQREWDKTITSANANNMLGPLTLFKGNSVGIGGIAGLVLEGVISDCYSRVAVYNTAAIAAGGIAGVTYMEAAFIDAGRKGEVNIGLSVDDGLSAAGKKTATLNQVYTTSPLYANKFVGGLVGYVGNGKIELNKATALNNYDSHLYDQVTQAGEISLGSTVGYANFATSSNEKDNHVFVNKSGSAIASGLYVVPKITRNLVPLPLNEVGNAPSFLPQGKSEFIGGAGQDATLEVSFGVVATVPGLTPYPFDFEANWSFDQSLVNLVFPELAFGKVSTVKLITNASQLVDVARALTSTYHVLADSSSGNVIEVDLSDTNLFPDKKWTPIGSGASSFTGSLVGRDKDNNGVFPTIRFKNLPYDSIGDVYTGFNGLFGSIGSGANISNITLEFDVAKPLSVISTEVNDVFGFVAQKAVGAKFNNVNVKVLNEKQVQPTGLYAFGGLVGESQSNNFVNCGAKFNLERSGYEGSDGDQNRKSSIYFGGIFGLGKEGANDISFTSGITYVDINIDLQVAPGAEHYLYVGGIAGSAGKVRVSGAGMNVPHAAISVDYRIDSPRNIYAGGAFGKVDGQYEGCENIFIKSAMLIANRANCETVYAGSVAGEAANLTLLNIKAERFKTGKINVGDTQAVKSAYVGAAIGRYATASTLTTAENIVTDIDIFVYTHGNTWVGGIFGFVQNTVNGPSSSTPQAIYNKLLSKGNIQVACNNMNWIARVGGIAGQTEINNKSSGIMFSQCAAMGDVTVSGYSEIYLGGLFGDAGIIIADSMAAVDTTAVLGTHGKPQLSMGGLVGLLNNHLRNSYAVGIVNQGTTNQANVGACIGARGSVSDVIQNVYYADDLSLTADRHDGQNENNGVVNISFKTDLLGKRMYANAMLSWQNFAGLDFGQIQNQTWKSKTSSGALVLTYPYLAWAEQHLGADIETRGKLYPFIADKVFDSAGNNNSSLETIAGSSNNYKVVHLNITNPAARRVLVDDLDKNLDIKGNIRLIAGVGTEFTVYHLYDPNYTIGNKDFGLFKSVSENSAISGITMLAENVSLSYVNTELNIGLLAAVNEGIIYGCKVGDIPQTPTTQLSEQEPYASPDSFSKLHLAFANSGATINAGALVGQNKGIVASSSSFIEFEIEVPETPGYGLHMGGLVGFSNAAVVKDCYTNGSVMVSQLSVNDKVSGVVGQADGGYLYRLFGYGEVTRKGGSNFAAKISSVAFVNSDTTTTDMLYGNLNMSALLALKANHPDDSYVNYQKFDWYLTDAGNVTSLLKENSSAWGSAADKNYGLPFLACSPDNLNTGNGTPTAAYHIWHEGWFWMMADSKYYASSFMLSNNIDILEPNSPDISFYGTLEGNSKTVTLTYSPKVESNVAYWGLFKTNAGKISNLNVRPAASFNLNTSVTAGVTRHVFGGIAATYSGNNAKFTSCTFTADEIDYKHNGSHATAPIVYGGITAQGEINSSKVTISKSYTKVKQVTLGDNNGGSGGRVQGITAGGLVGVLEAGSKITQCFAEDNITIAPTGSYSGGGGNPLDLATTDVRAELGGLVGRTAAANTVITDSYTYGGKLVVDNSHPVVTDLGSYSAGNYYRARVFLGTIIGYTNVEVRIEACYSYNYLKIYKLSNEQTGLPTSRRNLYVGNFSFLTFGGGNMDNAIGFYSNYYAIFAPHGGGDSIIDASHEYATNLDSDIERPETLEPQPFFTNSNVLGLRSPTIGGGSDTAAFYDWSGNIWGKVIPGNSMPYLIGVTPVSLREGSRTGDNISF
ncbi:MAG: Ig-like domain-containing protein [Firmicutes bacterium]|nr:Ig-like domain-containing protein [Bacillota bacterium]